MGLSFFPTPLPNELFYSIICRYSLLSGEKSIASVNEELFGNQRVVLPIEFPIKLAEFHRHCHSLFPYMPDDIIHNFSLFPFYAHFLSLEKAYRIKKLILRSEHSNIRATLGLNGSKVKSLTHPRYCIECAKEDIIKFSQFYIHREHQLPINICPEHNLILENLFPRDHAFGYARYLPNRNTVNETAPKLNSNTLLHKLSKASLSILKGGEGGSLMANHKEKLMELGFYRGRNIDVGKFVRRVQEKYGVDELNELIRLNVGNMPLSKYLMTPIHRQNRIINPIRHILLLDFIENSEPVTQLFARKKDQHGICLNKASDHYLQRVTNCVREYDSKLKQTIQIFPCDCGMIYKKYFQINSKNGNAKERIKIISYGNLWTSKLKEMRELQFTPYKISKILGVSIGVIKRFQSRSTEIPKSKEEKYKLKWQKLLTQCRTKGKTISYARKKSPGVYKWLYLNFKPWLLIENSQVLRNKGNAQLRIDWNEVDISLECEIRTQYDKLIQTGYNRRITKTLLLNSVASIKKLSKKNLLDRVPLSKGLISSVVESTRAFQQRKIHLTYKKLIAGEDTITYSLVIAKSNIRNPDAHIRSMIRALLK